MTMTQWNPLAELEDMRRKMDKLLEKSTLLVKREELPGQCWQPAADIYESETELVIELDLPGIVQEDIQVRIEDHSLLINGERQRSAEGDVALQRSERSYGAFSRVFALPTDIDENLTQARCEQGVLQIRLQKKTTAVPLRIDVDVK